VDPVPDLPVPYDASMPFAFESAPPLPPWLAREFPFRRRVLLQGGRRIHFVDEGKGRPVLLVHGNPTWSFVWRKVLRGVLAEEGLRVIAPDLLGFGLSSKPARPSDHTVGLHVETLAGLWEALGLQNVILVAQDWGGPIGLGAAAARMALDPSSLAGLVLGNTSVLAPRRPMRTTAFHRFSHLPIASDLAFRGLLFPVPVLDRVQGDRDSLGWSEKRAYAWPLRHLRDRAGPLGLARMVPDREDHPSLPALERIGAWARDYRGPVSLVWGTRDPILGRALARHQDAWPQASVTSLPAGHFLQEEVPEDLVASIRRIAA